MKFFNRKSTALFPKKHFRKVVNRDVATHLRTILFLILVICAGILLQILVFLNQQMIIAKKEYEANIKQFTYWSTVASQFPNIPDILYNASVSALNVGKKDKALFYIERAIQIDPLFKNALELKQIIDRG